jgi:WD40 repeat protein
MALSRDNEVLFSVANWPPMNMASYPAKSRYFFQTLWAQIRGKAKYGIFESHTGDILSLALSHDNQFLFSGTSSGRIDQWDLANRKLVKWKQTPHVWNIESLQVSPDGKYFFAGRVNGIVVWEINSDTNFFILGDIKETATSLAISADSLRLFAGYNSGAIRVWDLKTRLIVAKFSEHRGSVTKLALSPDERNLYSGSEDGTIREWNLERLTLTAPGEVMP